MSSIGTLLQAAEYLERREREAEHGYASTLLMPVRSSMRRKAASKQRKSQGSRSSHNELEKNRRAQLRYSLEQLKRIVPLAADSSRHTTLRLLTEAQALVRSLEESGRRQQRARDHLLHEQKSLRLRLAQTSMGMYRPRVEHSLSECSSTSSGSASSCLSTGDDADFVSSSSSSGVFSDSEEMSGSSSSSSIQGPMTGLDITAAVDDAGLL